MDHVRAKTMSVLSREGNASLRERVALLREDICDKAHLSSATACLTTVISKWRSESSLSEGYYICIFIIRET